MEFVSLYMRVLANEANIVMDKMGWKKALLSEAALVDFVPGIVMILLFGQLQLLALPTLATLGSSYADQDLTEQLVVSTGSREPDWRRLDSRLGTPRKVLPHVFVVDCAFPTPPLGSQWPHRLARVAGPTFKGMTEVLLKMADDSSLSVLQISNNDQVQVRVELAPDAVAAGLQALTEKAGCEVMFDCAPHTA